MLINSEWIASSRELPIGFSEDWDEDEDEFVGRPLREYVDLPTHLDREAKPGTKHELEDV